MNKEEDKPVLSWRVSGILLGVLLVIATALVKPLGVSTQYVVTESLILNEVAPDYVRSNEYLNKYGEKSKWKIGYGWMVVFGMALGGGLAALLTKRFRVRPVSEMWTERFGVSKGKRYFIAFLGGVFLLFGSRFGGGCTSGHMISGISQLAVSSFIFTIALFASSMTMAQLLYRKGDLK